MIISICISISISISISIISISISIMITDILITLKEPVFSHTKAYATRGHQMQVF